MILGIDLGGTNIKIAVVEKDETLFYTSFPSNSHAGFISSIPQLNHQVNLLKRDYPISGIGLATPGIVDPNQMRILGINKKFADLLNFDLRTWAQESFNLPFVLENDARAALYGEWKYGVGKDLNNLVGITLGTGIGTAAVVDGGMLIGENFIAGNLGGHMVLERNGMACNCGKVGCMEAQCSSWSLPTILKNHPKFSSSRFGDNLDFKSLFSLAQEEDPCAKEILTYCLEVWSLGISNLCLAFDPKIVILNGGLMAADEIVLPFIEKRINHKTALSPSQEIKVLKAKNKDTAAIFGLQYLMQRSLIK